MYDQIKWFRSIMNSNQKILRDCDNRTKVITSLYISDCNEDKSIVTVYLHVTKEYYYSKDVLCSSFLDLTIDEFRYLLMYIAYGYINSYIVNFRFLVPKKKASFSDDFDSVCSILEYDKSIKGVGVVVVQR